MSENKSRNLLFVTHRQYGYDIPYLNHCKYLMVDFNITYLCCDYGRKKIHEKGIEIIYISYLGNIFKRKALFIKGILEIIRKQEYKFVFFKYFKGCFIVPLIYRRKFWFHLDINSGSISLKPMIRKLHNLLLRYESHCFKSVSIISPGLKKSLKVSRNAHILPMGANPMVIKHQFENRVNMLYIGTLENRRIEETVIGLGLFMRKNNGADVNYKIIGVGKGGEIEQIIKEIEKYELHNHVELLGYIPHNNLDQYFAKANVGISYIPVTPGYDFQPPVKTFEYLMAGLPVIATNTHENRIIIGENNGILISDNPESFAISIEHMYDRIDDFNDKIVRESVKEYKWETIASKLKEYIMNCYDKMD